MEISIQQQRFKQLLLEFYKKAHESNRLTTIEMIRDIQVDLRDVVQAQESTTEGGRK